MSHRDASPAWLGGLVLILSGFAAGADEPPAPAGADGRALLTRVAAAYRDLPGYADQGRFNLAYRLDGQARTDSLPVEIVHQKPDRLAIHTPQIDVRCDGKQVVSSLVALKKYARIEAPKTLNVETLLLASPPTDALLFGTPSGGPVGILLNFLLEPDAAKSLVEAGRGTEQEPDRKIDGRTYRVLRLNQIQNQDFRLFVDPERNLVRRIELVFDPKTLPAPPETSLVVDSVRWDAGTIVTTVPKPEVFAFEPPKDFTRIAGIEEGKGQGGAGTGLDHPLVGKPSPDFTLTVLAANGKTRTIKKDELAGKVVILDLWATWCGPCLEELPELQKLVETLDEARKDVLVVAVSQDEDPAEPAEVRKLVETTLKKREIELTQGQVGLVAIDPRRTLGDVFGVQALPTLVVLDAKGIVQAVHIGFRPDIRKVLGRQVDTLLGGNPPVKP